MVVRSETPNHGQRKIEFQSACRFNGDPGLIQPILPCESKRQPFGRIVIKVTKYFSEADVRRGFVPYRRIAKHSLAAGMPDLSAKDSVVYQSENISFHN